MINGAIIYDQQGAKRNEWFIQNFITKAKDYDINLCPYVFHDNRQILNQIIKSNCKFAIVRAISPMLNFQLEQFGVKTFNSFNLSAIANNKYKTFQLAKQLDIPVMNTLIYAGNDTFYNLSNVSTSPFILKSVDGHGGTEVFMVENNGQAQKIQDEYPNKTFILQERCDSLGTDMRVYFLGDKILASVLRKAQRGFKSNYSLGGTVNLATPEKEQIDVISKLTNYLQPDFVGIDFIRHNGKWVLNEIEDSVGCRMLYQLTDLDVIDKYLSHINSQTTR